MRRLAGFGGALLFALIAAGCGDGEGSVEVTTWGEAYIEEGIPASEFEDGWSVRYSKFLVVIGAFTVADDEGAVGAAMKGSRLFDHTAPGVKPVARFDALPAKAWTEVSYEVPVASETTEVADGATADDLAWMRAEGWAIYVEGAATKDEVAKTFRWGFDAPTLYRDCRGEKAGRTTPGVLVTNGGTDPVQLTIHGDHLFYDDLQSPNARLRFDAIAAADADDDGEVTQAELTARKLVAIDPDDGAYGTGAAGDVNDLGAFVAALARTVGHFRGEGECFAADPK